MVIIFGWGAGEAKDHGEVAPIVCPNCHNDVFLHHIQTKKNVSLFFVPVVQYGSDQYLVCPICRQGLPIRPEHRAAVDDMHAATTLFRRGGLTEAFYRAKIEVFWRTIGVASWAAQSGQAARALPSAGPSPVVPAEEAPPHGEGVPGGSSPAGTPTLAEQLDGLARLHEDGVLTDEEFATAKARLIGG